MEQNQDRGKNLGQGFAKNLGQDLAKNLDHDLAKNLDHDLGKILSFILPRFLYTATISNEKKKQCRIFSRNVKKTILTTGFHKGCR